MRDLPDYDPAHGYQVIDHDTCEELVLPRPEPKVIVHRRPVVLYTTLDGKTRLATVGGISKVFPKCAASPSVLARIAVDRLHNHLALYRIERSFAELGCPLARSTLCQWMVWLIGKLYAVEDAADEAKLTPEARLVLRLLASRPLLARIGAWVARQRDAEPLESSFKKALNYVVNQWAALKRFLEDGRLRLDNNLSEAEFHVVGVGRRNWLFFSSREGLKSALVLYGLIRSCVAHGIDPYVYLVDVIRRVADTDTPARELIPSRWKQLPPLPTDKPHRSPAQLAGTG